MEKYTRPVMNRGAVVDQSPLKSSNHNLMPSAIPPSHDLVLGVPNKGRRRRNSSIVTFKECEHTQKTPLDQHKYHSFDNSTERSPELRSSLPISDIAFDSQVTNTSEDKPNSGKRTRSYSIFSKRCLSSEDIIAAKMNKAVWCLRILTLIALITAAAIVAALTFSYSRSAEIRQFREIYYDSVVKVEEAIAAGINNKLNAAKTFSALYTSRYSNDEWPNATMPSYQFEAQAAGQLDIANGIALSFNPIITRENRDAFEAHAEEFGNLLGVGELVTRSCNDTSGRTCRVVADGIYRKAPSPSGKGLININDPGLSEDSRNQLIMVPVWQIYPTAVNWRAVMFNLHSETNRQRALDDMIQYEVPAITALLHLVQQTEMNPSSILFYPVFNRFKNVGSSDFFRSPQRIVGSISIVFTWKDIFRRVLPAYVKGLKIVLESSASNSFSPQLWTYDMSGEDVTLLGEGDLHDPAFDEYEHSVQANVAREAMELGIVDFLITYKIRIYPSAQLQGTYLSNKPAIMTAIVVCIFILTSLIFLAYDYLLNNRQHAIMSFAQKSGHIVDAMFPANFRERVFSHNEHIDKHLDPMVRKGEESMGPLDRPDEKKKKFEKIRSFMNNRGRKDYYLRHDSNISGISANSRNRTIANLSTPTIADLFEETSVMFADIVGFTEWSSMHHPEEVFHLLETLFFEFDMVAMRFDVFKLGTIGDCYIAVTGIPDQNPDHGIKMCQFAEECRLKMHNVIDQLKHALDGVTNLSMRFGIHSGPVTAGVLRGKKPRFELFGDTINTASRMESLSLPGKIQVSQQTANLLVEGGHRDWITPRGEMVHAKGKGELQTYWLTMNSYLSEDEKNDEENVIEANS